MATSTKASREREHDESGARNAGLRYVSDTEPGLRRRAVRGGFEYVGISGRVIRDERVLKRIRKLAIPPAYTDVWICRDAQGHIQATGRDARGRKQYRYHKRWHALRDSNKFDRCLAFAAQLPRIRRKVARHLAAPGLPRTKVLAAVVRLLQNTHIRVGNEEYARHNGSYGLTTLRDRHVNVDAGRIVFQFRGKSRLEHEIHVADRRLANVVQHCQDLPGQKLFQFIDDEGRRVSVTSADVNAYLREIAGEDFSAKDFRTWAGTVATAKALNKRGPAETEADARRHVAGAIAVAAEKLGNTPAVCRKCYVHPAIVDAYLDLSLQGAFIEAGPAANSGLKAEERAVVRLLKAA